MGLAGAEPEHTLRVLDFGRILRDDGRNPNE